MRPPPELYSIYPFRQAWLGTPDKPAMARQSFHVRNAGLDGTGDWQPVETGGWQPAPVQAAHLGPAREAARLASINFHDRYAHCPIGVNVYRKIALVSTASSEGTEKASRSSS